MKNILNQSDNILLIVSPNGMIQFANKSALKFFKTTTQELKDLSIDSLLELEISDLSLYLNQSTNYSTRTKIPHRVTCYIDFTEQTWYDMKCFMLLIRPRRKELTGQLLQQLIEELPFKIWIQDENDQHIYTNTASINDDQIFLPESPVPLTIDETRERLLAYSNTLEWRTHVWGTETLKQHELNTKKARQYGQSTISEYTVCINGKISSSETYYIPLYHPTENKVYIANVSKDISLNKKLQQEVINQSNRLATLENFFHPSHIHSDYTYLFDKLNFIISHELHAARVSFWLYESEHNCVRYIYGSNAKPQDLYSQTTFHASKEKIAGLCHSKYFNKILPVSEWNNLSSYNIIPQNGITFAGTYEIKVEATHKLLGFLNVLYDTATPPPLHQEYVIQNACTQLGLLIQNHSLTQSISQEFLRRERTEKELEVTLTTAVDLFAIIDSQTGKFIKLNDKWETLLGWSSDELLNGIILPDLEYPPTGKSVAATLSYLNSMDSIRGYLTEYRCKNGEYKLLECNYKKIAGESLAIFTAKDITEQEKLKLQKKVLEDAVHLETLKSEFFATVSHELRTPLNIILATLQLLEDDLPSDRLDTLSNLNQNKYTKIIRQNAYRLLKLINNIIDMTKINDGYFTIKPGNYNIVSLVENITDSTVDYMHSKDIDFIFDTETEEEYIACDPDLIERIILNLLSNSIKYNNPEVKSLICMTLSLEKDFVVIRIQDNGIGIPNEKLEAIFERFVQVDHALSRKKEGSGIGLSLVKSLIEMHNGSISVRSQLGKGSEFTIKLPRKIIPGKDLEETNERLQHHSIDKYLIEFSDIYN